jgi:hypothetical protein
MADVASPRESHFWKMVLHILADFAYTITLLLALIGVHSLVDASGLSESFKTMFNKVHEAIFLGNYLLLG